ncbi:hypothetical protein [Kaistella sp.]|uniref:hypothetical protein n=1 Tax=Kaistella sp. TaxID=2782235 RepID=UPI003C3126E2
MITSGLNHLGHLGAAAIENGGRDKANVYIETDGLGHVYVEIGGTVYSYGRYDGSYSPFMGEYGLVGNGVLLKLR